MENRDFVITVLGVKDAEVIKRCMNAMNRYSENKWWLPDVNPREYAFYQIQEPVLLGTFVQLGESLMLLLDRYVEPEELIGNKIKEEAKKAWANQVEAK